ncbi:hypothetical protein ACWGLF_46435, partial [Streptomyces puniciscabiei]
RAGRPVLVPVHRKAPEFITAAGAPSWGLTGVPASAGISLLYHVHKLSKALSQAMTVDEVAKTALGAIMEPFGAQGMVINVVDADREWVAGHAGFPLEGPPTESVDPFAFRS